MHAYNKTLIYECFFYEITFPIAKKRKLHKIPLSFGSFKTISNVFVQF